MLYTIIRNFNATPSTYFIPVYNFFEELFKPFDNLKENDKIGFNEKINEEDNILSKQINLSNIKWEIYIDSPTYYQSFTRFYYKQNRTNLVKILEIMIDTYIKFKLTFFIHINSNTFIKLKNDIFNLNEKIKKGLDILSNTYKTDDYVFNAIQNLKKRI